MTLQEFQNTPKAQIAIQTYMALRDTARATVMLHNRVQEEPPVDMTYTYTKDLDLRLVKMEQTTGTGYFIIDCNA